MAEAALDQVVAELDAPRTDPSTLALPTAAHQGFSIDDAYVVQRLIAERRIEGGDRLVGRKVGLVDPAAQEALGVDEPIGGRLFASGQVAERGQLARIAGAHAKLECELAFLLAHDLEGPDVTGAHVLRATAGIAPAFEIIEDRLPANAQVPDMVADNCSGVGVVVGSALVSPVELDLVGTGVVLEIDGRPAGSGSAGVVMGNPARAVAWLANRLAHYGEVLRGGEYVLIGAVVPPVPVDRGRRFVARYGGGLGNLEVDGLG